MSLLLSFDPGKRTGLAIFNFETGEEEKRLVLTYGPLTEFLGELQPSSRIAVILVENYRQRPGVRQRGHTLGEAMRVIGQAESAAYRLGVPLIKQEPIILSIAAKWAGYKMPKGHIPDQDSAFLHGIYYLRQQGKYITALERTRGT